MSRRHLVLLISLFAMAVGTSAASGAAWVVPESLSPAPPATGTTVETPDVAISWHDDVTAAWIEVQADGTRRPVVRNRFKGSSQWGPKTYLDGVAPTGDASDVRIFLSFDGDATALWLSNAGQATGSVLSVTRPMGSTTWSSPITIDTGAVRSLVAGLNLSGEMRAAWIKQGSANTWVQHAKRGASILDPWSAPAAISDLAPESIRDLVMSDDMPLREDVVAWVRETTPNPTLQVATRSPNFPYAWTLSDVDTSLAPAISKPDVAMSYYRSAWVLTWLADGDASNEVWASVGEFPADPVTFTAVKLEAGNATPPRAMSGAKMFNADAGQEFTVMWGVDNVSSHLVRIAEATSTVWQPAVLFDDRPASVSVVDVESASMNGNVAVLWQEGGGPSAPLVVRHRMNHVWEAARPLGTASDGARSARLAQQIQLPSLAAVWTSGDRAASHVESNILDGTWPGVVNVQPASDTLSGMVGVPLTFSAQPSDSLTSATAIWRFGDGTEQTGNSVSHTYSQALDYYTVELEVRDLAGNSIHQYWHVTIAPAAQSSTTPTTPSTATTTTPTNQQSSASIWYLVQMTLPPRPKEAVISGKRVVVRAAVALRAGKKCTGYAKATMGTDATLRTASLKLAKGVQAGKVKCLGTGTVTPARAPRVDQVVTIKGLTILSRTVRVKAAG